MKEIMHYVGFSIKVCLYTSTSGWMFICTVLKNAATHIWIQSFMQWYIYSFLGRCPELKLRCTFLYKLLKSCQIIPRVVAQFYIPVSSVWRFQFLCITFLIIVSPWHTNLQIVNFQRSKQEFACLIMCLVYNVMSVHPLQ